MQCNIMQIVCIMLHYLRQDVCLHQSLIKRFLRDHSYRVKAIRTAGSTADWRLAALLIELKAQFYKLVTLNQMRDYADL